MRSSFGALLLFTPSSRITSRFVVGFRLFANEQRGSRIVDLVGRSGQHGLFVGSTRTRTMPHHKNDEMKSCADNTQASGDGLLFQQMSPNISAVQILQPKEVDRLLLVSAENGETGTDSPFAQHSIKASIVKIVNDAYEEGEKGILTSTQPGVPIRRVMPTDVDDMIQAQKLLVMIQVRAIPDQEQHLLSSHSHAHYVPEVIGCIKGEVLERNCDCDSMIINDVDSKVVPTTVIGEWGCLAVAAKHQGRGYGGMLVRAVEDYLTEYKGCTQLQLDLIAPSNWKHIHKERLRAWYTSPSMGYQLQVPNDYDKSTTRFTKGFVFANTFLVETDADMVKYTKQVVAVVSR
jgi:ribosomal protein S18 acetylase RimI-like enzyme